MNKSLEPDVRQEHQRMLLRYSIDRKSSRTIQNDRTTDGIGIYGEFVVPKRDSHGPFLYVKNIVNDNYEVSFNGNGFLPISIVTLKVPSEKEVPDENGQNIWIGSFKANLLTKIQKAEAKLDSDFKRDYLGIREPALKKAEKPVQEKSGWFKSLVGIVKKEEPKQESKKQTQTEEPGDHEEFIQLLERQPPQVKDLYQKERRNLSDLFGLLSVIEEEIWVDLGGEWVVSADRKSFCAKDKNKYFFGESSEFFANRVLGVHYRPRQ